MDKPFLCFHFFPPGRGIICFIDFINILIFSAALQTAPHLIDEIAFQRSMTWLRDLHQKFNGILTEDYSNKMSKDTKIAMIFGLASSSGHSPSSFSPVPMMGELYEGVIYDIAEDALENPYQV